MRVSLDPRAQVLAAVTVVSAKDMQAAPRTCSLLGTFNEKKQ